ncbi:MAG: hypothetical protein COU69_02765 [Candidatus Pacebacteria bacterium CG10_big_fil_rev_8_21_14_0_10_56_10]|nr:MAG: hypothetical protein COU69_02765 [Candidatus Pacebacteria bacterium CG10_big_fil_rev_8_21_14_0_10_56_10]
MAAGVKYIVNAIGEDGDFWITRFLFQRALGFTYLVAFLGVVNQFRPLLGDSGLLPVRQFVDSVSFCFILPFGLARTKKN